VLLRGVQGKSFDGTKDSIKTHSEIDSRNRKKTLKVSTAAFLRASCLWSISGVKEKGGSESPSVVSHSKETRKKRRGGASGRMGGCFTSGWPSSRIGWKIIPRHIVNVCFPAVPLREGARRQTKTRLHPRRTVLTAELLSI